MTVNMAEEPWNKVNIPIPSAVSLSRITFSASTGDLIERLLADCERVLTLLCSSVLQTEIRVLYEILYVLNNSFRQHKPFRAIKQVEQCINRLKEMNLRAAIEDLKDLCPNQYQRDAGTEMGECDVPSQPMLEWICLKLLGASSLLARTMDRTIRAFLRTRQHLHLTEFIVLNTVLTSMLSRLWVFFRGILKALIPMYQRTTELLQQVAQSQPMPYLTDFTLPEDLKTFLGPLHPELQIEESTTEPLKTLVVKGKQTFSFLSKLFGDKEGKEEERGMIPGLSSGFDVGSSLDLGTAVLKQRPEASPSGLLMKDLLQRSCKHSKQILSLEPRVKLNASNQAAVHQKRKFLKALRTVSSFRDMAAHLKEMIYWCKCCKFWIERKRLAYLSLKCLRMESLEAEGLRVERRLKTFKLKVQKAVMLERTFPAKRSCSLFALWRTRWHPRARFRSSRYGTVKHRSSFARMCTTTVKDLFGASLKRCYPEQSSVEKVSGCNVVPGHEEEKLESQSVLPKQNIPKDDIDDIFASIGF